MIYIKISGLTEQVENELEQPFIELLERTIKQAVDEITGSDCTVKVLTNNLSQSVVASGGSVISGVTQINNR